MHHPPRGVPPLAPELKLRAALSVGHAVEARAVLHELFNTRGRVGDAHLHDVALAQARPGHLGVFDVGGEGVGGVEHRGDAPLGPVGGRVGAAAFGHDQHVPVGRGPEREGEPGDSAAQDEIIGVHAHGWAATILPVGHVAQGPVTPP
jgi:hypothetical protein